ncbi:hypothetical protein [Buchananella hordeovulneris]|uniref:hypothetical protein n=1 Tax=Buchananella hordeovulneris TaxID=52770 RepID=UPI0026DCD1C8|nr:hypothetical protein [Buchananella hordeovulneris]MDO5080545.1 hypothetical protein [Buchananella hordeovulneris]
MTDTILAQSNKLPSPQPKAFFLAAAITLLLTLTACAAEDFADEEIAACKNGETFPASPNTVTTIHKSIRLNCSGVYDTDRGLASEIAISSDQGTSGWAELAVGESFTVENIGKFTLIRAREEPNLPFFLSSPDSVGICFEPDPDFTSAP